MGWLSVDCFEWVLAWAWGRLKRLPKNDWVSDTSIRPTVTWYGSKEGWVANLIITDDFPVLLGLDPIYFAPAAAIPAQAGIFFRLRRLPVVVWRRFPPAREWRRFLGFQTAFWFSGSFWGRLKILKPRALQSDTPYWCGLQLTFLFQKKLFVFFLSYFFTKSFFFHLYIFAYWWRLCLRKYF